MSLRFGALRTAGRRIIRFPAVLAALLVAATLSGCGHSNDKIRISERADRYFKAGDYDKAKIEYLSLLRLDPNRSDLIALQRLGFIWLEQGAPSQAYPFLSKARELAPDNLEVRTKLARVMASLGATDQAKEEALAVLQKLPGQEDALLILVDSVQNDKDIAEVGKQLLKVPEGNDLTYHLARASLAARQGDLTYAQGELETCLKLAPNSARVHLSLAKLYSLEQDWEKAGREYRVAAELSPARSAGRLNYVEFEKQIGKTEESVHILKEVVRAAPDYLPAWCLLAETALLQNKFDETIALLENVLTRDPTNRDGLVLLTRAWLGKGEAKKAQTTLERLAEIYPHVPIINYYLAQAYLAQGDIDSAINALNDAITVQPDYTEAILLQAEIEFRAGNPSVVIASMLRLLKLQPRLVPAQTFLAEAYRATGRLDDAAATIREQINSAPSADAYLRLGLVLRDRKKINEARDAFEQAAKLAPNDFQAIEQLIDLDLAQKNVQAAMRRVQQQFANEPNSAQQPYLEGKIYAAQNDWERAETSLREALKRNPNFSSAFDLLITVFISTHKFHEASEELQRLVAKEPRNIGAITNLARVYTIMTDYPKARDTYEKLLSLNPGSTEAMNNLAYLYAEYLEQPDKAYEIARKARAMRPGDALIADTLGWILYKNGDYGEALTLLQESVRKLPANRDVQLHFGMANYMMGETAAAETALKKALAVDVDVGDKAEAQRRLVFLEKDSKQRFSADELEALLREHRDDVIAWLRLGEVYEKTDVTKSARAYGQAFELNPELLRVAIKMAEILAGPLRDYKMAFSFAQKARDLAPNDGKVAGLLGRIVYRLGNFSWAYSLLQESARKMGDDVEVLQDYAWTAYFLGKVDESRQLMERIINLNSDAKSVVNARDFLAMTALMKDPKHLSASEHEIEKVLTQEVDFVPALLAKVELQHQRGDTKSAIALCSELLRRYPDFALAQKRLAELLVDDPNQLDEAYNLALKARNALPDDSDLAKTLGQISYKKGDFNYAIQCFLEGARKKPLSARDLYFLGMAQLKMSQDFESTKTLEKALAAGLEEPMLGDAKATITELHRRTGL